MESNQKVQVMRTLWGALLFSQFLFIYLTVNYLYVESVVGPDEMVLTLLPSLGFFVAIASFVMNRKALAQKKFDQFFVFFIIGCALAEAINILGVVGVIMALPLHYYYSFAATGIALHLYYFPRSFSKE